MKKKSTSIMESSGQSSSQAEELYRLQDQCRIRDNAIQTAEQLIRAYQKENIALREDNTRLTQENNELRQIAGLQISRFQREKSHQLQQAFQESAEKVHQLMGQKFAAELKIAELEDQLKTLEVEKKKWKMQTISKLRKHESKEKEKRKYETKFSNYLRLAGTDQEETEVTPQSVKMNVLEKQLQEKQRQIGLLLRRVTEAEGMLDRKRRRQRLKTNDSLENYSLGRETCPY